MKVSEYRDHARERRKLVLIDQPEHRAQLLRMADCWERLADEQERLIRLREEPGLS